MASSPNKSFSEADALILIEMHRASAFERTFKGTELKKKAGLVRSDAGALLSATNDLGSAVAAAAGAGVPDVVGILPINDLMGLVLKLCGLTADEWDDFAAEMAEELAVIGGTTLLNVAQTFLPYVSTIVSGKDMVIEWGKCALEAHSAYKLGRTIGVDILPGNAACAADAVCQLISRSSTNHARLAVIHTAKFSVDVAATAGGFGAGGAAASAITGAAAAGAKVANSLFLLGRDYIEIKTANTLLLSGRTPSATALFSGCPLLGCYLICGADDSDLLFFMVTGIGKAGWMDEIERQKKRSLAPLQAAARRFIEESRYDLSGFSGNKVMVLVPARKSKLVHLKSAIGRLIGV